MMLYRDSEGRAPMIDRELKAKHTFLVVLSIFSERCRKRRYSCEILMSSF